MATIILKLISKSFRYTLLAVAILYILVCLYIILSRITYPFELEWMEGGSLIQIIRILAGDKLYVSPSIEFIPLTYPPLYFYLSAFVASIVGVGFFPLRLLSLVSSLGCFVLLFLFVKRQTGCKFSGLLAVGLFAATFRISGAWFDIGRVDALLLLFLLIALYLIKLKTSRAYFFAGVFFTLSFLTKQTAFIVFGPILLYSVFENRRLGIILTAATVIPTLIVTLCLNYVHDGWYNYYLFYLPSKHTNPIQFIVSNVTLLWKKNDLSLLGELLSWLFAKFWLYDMLAPLFIACAVTIAYFSISFIKSSPKKDALFYVMAAIGMLGLSWAGRSNLGGYNNVLLPAYAMVSILFALGVHKLLTFSRGSLTKRNVIFEIVIYLICFLQLISLRYPVSSQIPTQLDLVAGRKLVDTIQGVKGDVFIPCHGYLGVMAGKKSYVHEVMLGEMVGRFGGGDKKVEDQLFREIKEAMQEGKVRAVLFDTKPYPQLANDLNRLYVRKGSIFTNKTVFRPLTGKRSRPEFLYVLKKDKDAGRLFKRLKLR